MTFRDEILRRLKKKKDEIDELDNRIFNLNTLLVTTKSYVQGIEDTLKLIPKEEEAPSSSKTQAVLREGSAIWLAQKVILEAGQPLHVSALLKAMGKDDTPANRVSLAGSLGAYTRDKKVFTRPAPNVFGLIEMGDASPNDPAQPNDSEGIELVA
jgi:hypothetical protein